MDEHGGRNKHVIITGINHDKDIEVNVRKRLEKGVSDCKISTINSKNPGIVVQFLTEDRRNRVLEKMRKNELNTQNRTMNDFQTKIYVNEDLPRELF